MPWMRRGSSLRGMRRPTHFAAGTTRGPAFFAAHFKDACGAIWRGLAAGFDLGFVAIAYLAPTAARATLRLAIFREADLTALTMFWYPVQRQRFPLIFSRISASLGSGE